MHLPSWLRRLATRPISVRARRLQRRPTFGTGGIVTAPFTNNPDVPEAVATPPDGKIVVAGYTQLRIVFADASGYVCPN